MPGRFAAESVADFKRNQWPIWRGIGGRFGAESPHDFVMETRDGCKELVSLCNAWIAEQTDFEVSEMKKAMVLAFFEKIQNVLSKVTAEFWEIEPRIMALAAKIQGADDVERGFINGKPI